MNKTYIPLSTTPLLSSSKSKDVGCDIVLTDDVSTGKCSFDNKVIEVVIVTGGGGLLKIRNL